MASQSPGEAPVKLEGEALVAKVQETLEALLSKKNLVKDQFLAGNMNPQMYIPIRILLVHEKLKAAGATPETISAAAKHSTRLGIDEAKTMVRPLLKSKRNVIILRDIPDGTTEEEVRSIFKDAPQKDKIKDIKAEVNNSWFVKFDLDDGTQEVVLWLRSQQFKGKTVNANIKSEHFLRSFFPVPGATFPGGGPPMGFAPDMMNNPMLMPGPPQQAFDSAGFDGGGFLGPMGFDSFDGKGKGKGKMQFSSQPPGYWQPWGSRPQPPPIILPTTKPDVPATASDWKGGKSWQDEGEKGWGWQEKGTGGWEKGWQKGWDTGGKGKGKEGNGKGKWHDYNGKGWNGHDEKGWKGYDEKGWKGYNSEKGWKGYDEKGWKGHSEKGGTKDDKGGKGKGKEGKASKSEGKAAQAEDSSSRKAKGGAKWKVRDVDSAANLGSDEAAASTATGDIR